MFDINLILFILSFTTLALTTLFYVLKKHKFAFISLILSNFQITSLLSYRWFVSGYFPTSNLYESLIFLTWCFTFFQICIPFIYVYNSNKSLGMPIENSNETENKQPYFKTSFNFVFINQVLSFFPLFMYSFAVLKIPEQISKVKPLIPALQSNWLIMHVSTMISSYATLMIGSILSFIFCFIWFYRNRLLKYNETKNVMLTNDGGEDSINSYTNLQYLTKPFVFFRFFSDQNILEQKLNTIDLLAYQFISFGFPLLTLGIISGAVWANEAWGSFWSWDIKEIWSLITWFIYAFYLHTRLNFRWQGIFSASIAVFGFFIICFCYIGVNFIAKGLHSYGWVT